MFAFSFEFWCSADQPERITVYHRSAWYAKQVVIGRFAPIFIRRI